MVLSFPNQDAAIGHVSVSWNEVEYLWFRIYEHLLHETPEDKAGVIFKQFLTGAAQRQLVMAISKVALQNHTELREQLGRLHALTNDVSGDRNAAVHARYAIDISRGKKGGPSVVVIDSDELGKPNRLAGKELLTELRRISFAINDLRNDLTTFWMKLAKEFPR